jgi:hypothetical protein
MNAQLSWLDRPYQRHSETSQEAANSITESRAETDRAKILRYIRAAYGATDGEIQTALCMDGNTERPRRVELLKRGDIRDSGRRHRTASGREAVVWESAT